VCDSCCAWSATGWSRCAIEPTAARTRSWLAQQLESGGRDSIGGPAEWAQKLRIPPARLGRLLVVEDALRAALAAADKTMTDS
jgi:hypothetical protein